MVVSLARVLYESSPNHIEISVDYVFYQMFVRLDSSGMISVFPKRTFPFRPHDHATHPEDKPDDPVL